MFTKKKDNYRKMLDGVYMKNLAHGDKTCLCQFKLEKGAVIPNHAHPHEQTGHMVSGEMIFKMEGQEFHVQPGDSWCIPGDVAHAVDVIQESIVVEMFAPVRTEYLEQ